MSRRTLRICLFLVLAIALCGAVAQALPAGAALSLPFNAEKIIPPAGMTIGLELFRPMPDGSLVGPIASWDTGQPTRPTVLDCMAVRIRVFPMANSVGAVKVSDDKYGRELAKGNDRRAEEKAQYAELQPNVGWSRMIYAPLTSGFLSLDATVWSKDVMNQYQVGRRSEERKTFGQALAVVKQSPANWQSYSDEDLVRGFMKGWEYLGAEEIDPGYLASKAAKAAMQAQLARAAQPVAPPFAAQPAAPVQPAPREVAPVRARLVSTIVFLSNGRFAMKVAADLPSNLCRGDYLVFKQDGEEFAKARIDAVRPQMKATMVSGVGSDISDADVYVRRSGGR